MFLSFLVVCFGVMYFGVLSRLFVVVGLFCFDCFVSLKLVIFGFLRCVSRIFDGLRL